METSVTETCITAQVTTCKKCSRDTGLENHTYLPQGHWPCIHSLSERTGLFCLLQEFSQDEWPHYLSTSVCLFSYPAENKKNVHPVGFQTGVKNSKLVLSDQNQVIMFLSSSLWVFPFCLVFLLCLHVCICPAATRLAPWEHHFDSTTTLCSCLSVLWSVARKGNFLFWHQAPFCLDLMCLCSNTSSG